VKVSALGEALLAETWRFREHGVARIVVQAWASGRGPDLVRWAVRQRFTGGTETASPHLPSPSAGPRPELLIDCGEDRTLRAVLVGMVREWGKPGGIRFP
jgi:hypothetical protein